MSLHKWYDTAKMPALLVLTLPPLVASLLVPGTRTVMAISIYLGLLALYHAWYLMRDDDEDGEQSLPTIPTQMTMPMPAIIE